MKLEWKPKSNTLTSSETRTSLFTASPPGGVQNEITLMIHFTMIIDSFIVWFLQMDLPPLVLSD